MKNVNAPLPDKILSRDDVSKETSFTITNSWRGNFFALNLRMAVSLSIKDNYLFVYEKFSNMIQATNLYLTSNIRKPTIFRKLAQICKTTCGTATQCIAAAKGAEKSNTNVDAQGQLMDSCKHTADFIPRIIEAVRLMKLNPAMAMAQLNLINTADPRPFVYTNFLD